MTARERILAWLRESPEPVSGAALAGRLGCTRAAVWKHVAALRRAGHEISGQPASGYRLVREAERLDAATLGPRLAGSWRRIEWRDRVDSTQHLARELAQAGAPEGTVVLADHQRRGRGRLGRAWHSPPGVNLYLTLVLRPSCAPADVPPIALVAGLAVADAVRAAGADDVRLKWPNDVQLGGRKVAGVLTEMQGTLEQVEYVLVGIGVNVNLEGEAFPAELAPIATSLRAELGRPVDRVALAARLLAALEARYARYRSEGLQRMRGEWQALSSLTGRLVEVSGAGAVVRGRALGIDEAGALLVEGAGGECRRVVAGDVTLRAEAGA